MTLTADQQKLKEKIAELSQNMYCAGWLSNIEYMLWDCLYPGDRIPEYTPLESELQELRELHEKTGGWIWWNEEDDADGDNPIEFIPTAKWLAKVKEWREPIR